jgi:glycosyltransferase involved in cell wall biosynthesis
MTRSVDDAVGERFAALAAYELATAWLLRGRSDRARVEYERLTELHPEFVPAYLDLGRLLLQAGDRDAAHALYLRGLEFHPKDAGLRSQLERLNGESLEATASVNAPVGKHGGKGGHILLYTDCPGIHGAEQTSHLLVRGLVSAGYRVTYAQSRASHHLIREREKMEIEHLWIEQDNLYDPSRTPRTFSNHAEARQVFASAQPDLIIFANGSPFSNLAAEEIAAELGLPYLVVTHCATAAWADEHPAALPRLADIYRHAHTVIAVCHENLEVLHSRFGLPKNQGQVIYPARSDIFFLPRDLEVRRHIRRGLDVPVEAVVCLTVARMERMKGYQYLEEAISQLRRKSTWEHVYFVWAGSGTMEGRLRAHLIELGVEDHVKFAGERADIQNLYDAADLFALPSEFEGMPGTIIEAEAKGLPVLASAVSGIPEEIGDTGKLLPNPKDDPEGMVRELVQTIHAWAQDPVVRANIGSRGRARAEALFRAEGMIDQYIGVVEHALHRIGEAA